MHLTHKQVKRLSDKDVEKFFKRYESYVGSKTTETLIDSFLMFATKALCTVLPVKNVEALQAELKKDSHTLLTKSSQTWPAILL